MNKAATGTARAVRPEASLEKALRISLWRIGIAFSLLFLLVIGATVQMRFAHLEESEVQDHYARAESYIGGMKADLKAISLDWGVWDETFYYLRGENPGYESENLDYDSIANMGLNALGYVRFDRTFAKATYADYEAEDLNPEKAREFAALAASPTLRARARKEKAFQAFVRQDSRLLAIAVAQVLHNDGSGTPEGYIVLGKEVGSADFGNALNLPAMLDFKALDARNSTQFRFKTIHLEQQILGIDGKPVATLHLTVPRNLMNEMLLLMALAGAAVIVTMAAQSIVLGRTIRKQIVQPIVQFQEHVGRIAESGEIARYEAEPREDEIGRLTGEFNEMADELTALRARVEAQSFIIGKRDSSTSTMHNIGNAVTPVKTILTKLEGQMVIPVRTDVNRALDELGQEAEPESREAKLLEFLRTAFNHGAEATLEQRELVRTALRSTGNVEEMISTAMSESRADPLGDTATEIAPIIGNSIALARQYHAGVAIEQEADGRYLVRANRVLLAQVIENLLKNAAEAIAASGREGGRIDIAVSADHCGKLPAVRITLKDNGEGFAPERAAKLFERGQSTRNRPVSGLGLHWCANTINAMGGALTLESEGPGQGATATIRLPLDPASIGSDALAA